MNLFWIEREHKLFDNTRHSVSWIQPFCNKSLISLVSHFGDCRFLRFSCGNVWVIADFLGFSCGHVWVNRCTYQPVVTRGEIHMYMVNTLQAKNSLFPAVLLTESHNLPNLQATIKFTDLIEWVFVLDGKFWWCISQCGQWKATASHRDI